MNAGDSEAGGKKQRIPRKADERRANRVGFGEPVDTMFKPVPGNVTIDEGIATNPGVRFDEPGSEARPGSQSNDCPWNVMPADLHLTSTFLGFGRLRSVNVVSPLTPGKPDLCPRCLKPTPWTLDPRPH